MAFRVDPEPWALADERRVEIEAHFARLKQANPHLWNGAILMLGAHDLAGGVLSGRYKRTDFASLLWWRDHGCPELCNAFGMGALRGSDGAFVLGRMAPWTANAGRIYFAAGTPDLGDITTDGRVDIDGSVLREIEEEVGLTAADFLPPPEGGRALHGVFAGRRIALMREIVTRLPGEELAARLREHLAAQKRAELDAIILARSPADIDPAMPDFIRAYLHARWSAGGGIADVDNAVMPA
nr:NUDIX hydrolase [Ancylobacter gelatini]